MSRDIIKDLFIQYPEAKELYQDARGNLWVIKTTAETQGGKVTVIKRSDYFKTEKE